jgi:hypothetical protein
MMFKSRFDFVMEADNDVAPEEQAPTPETDKDAMAQNLDTAKPEDFDVKAAERAQRVDHVKIEQIKKLNEWISHIDQFIGYLNEPANPDSLQMQLHTASCDSMFEEIARSEKKKIARLAADLGNLNASLKGYLASAND